MIKENIATEGVPMPLGTAATELTPAPHDAPPAARLREAGAVILGKTTMPDYGMLSSGLSSFHPLTRNPWDLSHGPGGSSAGAGAGAAAGYGPLHVGTDIGGSVRLPAGWCGIFTLKPSLGRIPIHPPYAGRVAGPMTRTVEDAALMMAVLSRPDARDTMSLPAQASPGSSSSATLEGLRIGLLLDAGWGLPVDPDVRVAVEAAARAFEEAGAIVEPLAPFTTRAMADGMDASGACARGSTSAALRAERRARVLPFIVEWARGGAALIGRARVPRLQPDGRDARRRGRRLPAVRRRAVADLRPVPAFAAELPCPTNDPQRPFEHIAFTLPYNMSEQPAASHQLRLHRRRAADRPADRRPSPRRPDRAAGGPRVGADAAGAAAWPAPPPEAD